VTAPGPILCPACGSVLEGDIESCPKCHLSGHLFSAVREAAGPLSASDPASLRTIGELLATVDLAAPASPGPAPGPGLLSRSSRFPPLPTAATLERAPASPARAVPPLHDFPALPPAPTEAELRRKIDEYFHLGRRLGLDFTDFEGRDHAASLTHDTASLETIAREMFVHLTSSIAEEFEGVLSRRNELVAFAPTPSADVELDAIRLAVGRGDLSGAQRRLAHVRDELQRSEEAWEVGKILVAEAELLATTTRELGGDPDPALGPLEEGRRLIREGHRADGERLLARAAVALWSVLEPRLTEDLRRLRDRLVEVRAAGADIDPAIQDLRSVLTELRQRNFVGTILAYRRVRSFVEQQAPAGEEIAGAVPVPVGVRPPTAH
jgi:hypothetical protein